MSAAVGPVEVIIDGFTHGGEGVGRIDGKVVLVAGALPGERVRVEVLDDRARWSRGQVVEVLVASPDRVVPPCPVADVCGGCDLQHVDPAAARALKTRVVREQLARLGGLGAAADALVAPCRAVGPDLGYRNHIQLHAAADGRLGFHRFGTRDVVPIDSCLVASPAVDALRGTLGDASGAAAVTLRALGGTQAAVVTPGSGPVELPEGIPTVALRAEGRDPVVVRGESELSVTVAGLPMRVPLAGFFQVNDGGAEALVAEVLAQAGDVTHRDVWDLYAGVGLLSLPLARAGAHVLAIESDPAAAAAARTNAAALELDVTVLAERVERVTARVAGGDRSLPAPETVIADPPRAGLGARVVADLVRLTPERIVLVSCDVAALARDVKDLVAGGYRPVQVVPLDLFPMTHHVETVTTLVRG
jgi:tRNA/tmRNA/rRNA uracil-C5-methylase (TrmA/RlmC/RlmD family)